jgi:hypothetical protein
MDQTPAPFEYLDGQTYEAKGAKTVQAKSDNSGWDKRQASLKVIIIFHGQEFVSDDEYQQYDERVQVMFNDTAYCDEEVMHKFIDGQIVPYLREEGP